MVMLLKIGLVMAIVSAAPLVGAQIGRHAAGSAGTGSTVAERNAAVVVPAKPRRTGSVHFKNQSAPEIVGTPSACCVESMRSRVGQWI
jgi:hypothetical protein